MTLERSKRGSSDGGRSIARHVVFWVGRRCLAMPIDAVREVVDLQRAVPVPMAPALVIGIVSLRGTILSVIDAERMFSGRAMTSANAKVLVLIRDQAVVSGLAVDRVHGVVAMPGGEFLRDHSASRDPFVLGHYDVGMGELVAVLDAPSLFHHIDSQRFSPSTERPVTALA
jgi:chemotaxis signal transduction protein